jgi:hypothetical protein
VKEWAVIGAPPTPKTVEIPIQKKMYRETSETMEDIHNEPNRAYMGRKMTIRCTLMA